MNQTTNYNFNVPVGSDIVNPLVQDFPNWESLDAILRNVANTGITTATHTKTGTIHTLTFSETTVPMIRFQATADFNTNDAFTVNGVSVSALTVSGQALPDGAFVIGSMVLCELRDNLLTVYSSGTNANTLEGHSASYFATASGLETVDDKADANKVLIDQITADLGALFKVVTFMNNSATSVPANSEVDIELVTYAVPTGYSPIAIMEFAPRNNLLDVEHVRFYDNRTRLNMKVHNTTAGAINALPLVTVLFAKSGTVSYS